MAPINIGTVTLRYDEEGVPIESQFAPEAHSMNSSIDLLHSLLALSPPKDAEAIKGQADLVLADWFAHVSDIELADREQTKIESTILECQEWPNGRPKLCQLRFTLVPL